jgi:hypothetical protein
MKRFVSFLFFLAVQTFLFAQEYYPEGTKWTEIRLDTLKYDSWYSKVGDEWVPNFETVEYYVQGEYVKKEWDDSNIFKRVYTNGPEWTDSLTLLIIEGEQARDVYGQNCVLVSVLNNATDGLYALWPGEAYQFDWSVGKELYYQDITMSNTTSMWKPYFYYGIIDEIKEGYFGGVKPLKYVDLDGKAPEDETGLNRNISTNGGRIIQGIGITEWNDGECLFGPPNPYFASTWEMGKRHYRSMLVHFERNGEVLYDVWPEKKSDDAVAQEADMFVDKRKSWRCLNEMPGWEPEVHMYEFSGDVTANGKTYSELLMDGSHPYLLRQEGNKVFMIDNNSPEEVLLYDFGLEVGDKFSFTGKESENLVVMDVDFITVGDRVRRRMIFAWERYLPKDYDVQSLSSQDYSAIDCWVEGIGSVYSPVSPMTPFMIGGRYRTQSCLLDGSVIFSYSDFGVDSYNPQNGSSVAIPTQTENVRQPVFDLQGRKLLNSQWSNSQIRRGLYIQNGRKVVVK